MKRAYTQVTDYVFPPPKHGLDPSKQHLLKTGKTSCVYLVCSRIYMLAGLPNVVLCGPQSTSKHVSVSSTCCIWSMPAA